MPRLTVQQRRALRRKAQGKKNRAARRAAKKANGVLVNKSLVNGGLSFPKKLMLTHKYNDVFTLTSSSGVIGKYQFSCNALYDPNYTSSGHKPLYFNDLTSIYDHYTVIGSKIRVRLAPSTSSTPIFSAGMYIDDDNTTTNIAGITTCAEQPSGQYRLVPPAGMGSIVTMTSKWSAKKTFGGSILGNDNLQGNATSVPAEQSFYTLCVQATGTDTAVALVDVEITYIAIWDELKDRAQNT